MNDLTVRKLDFADMDGDGRADVFYANGRLFRYKSAGTGPWIELAIAAADHSEVHAANFDTDTGRADIFFPGCM